MKWHQLPLDSVAPAPWRNGGGTTRELLAWPDAADWSVRVSVANVSQAGPFSSFAGVERWFAVLAGDGVNLDIDGRAHEARLESQPLCFDGGARVDCGLPGGPTEDFNLMLRGRSGTLERLAGLQERACRRGSLVGVYSHDHEISFFAVEVRTVVPPRTLAWNVMPADERIDFTSAGALWFEVQP